MSSPSQISTIITVATLLLFLSSSVSHAKPPPSYREQCPAILSKAVQFDRDGSGGLNQTEFDFFWADLIDSGVKANVEPVPLLRETVSSLYTTLLCQCHYSFDNDLQCCDDTATEDDDDVPTELAIQENTFEIWTEVSVQGF